MILAVLIWLGSGAVVCLLVLSVIEREVRPYREMQQAEAPRRTLDEGPWDWRESWDFDTWDRAA